MQAHLASILANVNRDSRRRAAPYRVDEFLLYQERKDEPRGPILLDDPNAQSEAMITAMFGGMKVIRSPDLPQ